MIGGTGEIYVSLLQVLNRRDYLMLIRDSFILALGRRGKNGSHVITCRQRACLRFVQPPTELGSFRSFVNFELQSSSIVVCFQTLAPEIIRQIHSTGRPVTMATRSPSPGRDRSRTRSPTPRSASSRSPSRRRRYDARSPSRSPTPPSRRNGRHRSDSRSWSRGRGRGTSREPSEEPPVRSTKASEPRQRQLTQVLLTLPAQIVVERLSKNINEDHLYEIFGDFGPIKDLDLPINRTCTYFHAFV